MKHKYNEKFKKLVRKAVSDYTGKLGYHHYETKVHWYDENLEPNHNGDVVLAQCSVDHRYLLADFKIYPALELKWLKKKYDEEDVRRCVAHEVAHIATHKLHYMATSLYKDEGETTDAWEALTTVVGRLLYDVEKK